MAKKENLVYTKILVIMLVVASFSIGRLSIQMKSTKQENNVGVEGTNASAEADVNGSKIAVSELKNMAKSFGVDMTKFNKCLDDGTKAEQVTEELKEGISIGVNGTPMFYINGILIDGAKPQTDFEKVIDAEIKNGSGLAVAKQSLPDAKRQSIPYGKGYVKGNPDARIKMIEYVDFECPQCNRAFPTIEALLDKYGDKISLEYRSFPLPYHKNAQKAAEAAHCAGEQGKFWEMHDQIFRVMAKQ